MSRRRVGDYHKVEAKAHGIDFSLTGYLTILGEDEYNGGYMQFGSQDKDTPHLNIAYGKSSCRISLNKWKSQVCNNIDAIKIRRSDGLSELFRRLNDQFREFVRSFEKDMLVISHKDSGTFVSFDEYYNNTFDYVILTKSKCSANIDSDLVPDLMVVDKDSPVLLYKDLITVDAELNVEDGTYILDDGSVVYPSRDYIPVSRLGQSSAEFIDLMRSISF